MRLDSFGIEKDDFQHEQTQKTKREVDQQHEIERLNQELSDIQQEEGWLDDMISTVNNQLNEMAEDQLYDQFAYVTYDDIKKLSNLPENKNSTLLAIRAPPGTKLEIPEDEPNAVKPAPSDLKIDENEGETKATPGNKSLSEKMPKERGIQTNDKKRYQIMLNSGGEEILLFVLKNEESSEIGDNEPSEDHDHPDSHPSDHELDTPDLHNHTEAGNKPTTQLEVKVEKAGEGNGDQNGRASPQNAQNIDLGDDIDTIFSVSNMFTGEN